MSITFQDSVIAGPAIKFQYENTDRKTSSYSALVVCHKQKAQDVSFSVPNTVSPASCTILKADNIKDMIFKRYDFEIPQSEQSTLHEYQVCDLKFKFKMRGLNERLKAFFYSCNEFHSQEERQKAITDGTYDHTWKLCHSMLNDSKIPDIAIGCGDQVYGDGVWELPFIKAWSEKYKISKEAALHEEFTPEMEREVTDFFVNLYAKRWSVSNDYGRFLARVPSLMTWDDHDSYNERGNFKANLEECKVIKGINRIADQMYALFQQQRSHISSEENSNQNETSVDQPLKLVCPGSSTEIKTIDSTGIVLFDTRTNRKCDKQVIPKNELQSVRDYFISHQADYERAIFVIPVPLFYVQSEKLLEILKQLDNCPELLKALREGKINAIREQFNSLGEIDLLPDFLDQWSAHQEEKKRILKYAGEIRKAGINVLFVSGDSHHPFITRITSPGYASAEANPYDFWALTTSPIVNTISPIAKSFNLAFAEQTIPFKNGITLTGKLQPFHPEYHPTQDVWIAPHHNWLEVQAATEKAFEYAFHVENPDMTQTDYHSMNIYTGYVPAYHPLKTNNLASADTRSYNIVSTSLYAVLDRINQIILWFKLAMEQLVLPNFRSV